MSKKSEHIGVLTTEELALKAKEAYDAAYAEYIVAAPGRDLTIKQGIMHRCKDAFVEAVMDFFDEYERSKLL